VPAERQAAGARGKLAETKIVSGLERSDKFKDGRV
jgi:hypothetical protein